MAIAVRRHPLCADQMSFSHSQYPDTWLINGLIQMSEVGQLALDLG